MSLTDINIREKKFHNELHAHEKNRSENKFYKATYHLYEDFFKVLEKIVKNKDVLDYGCGIGNFAERVNNFYPKKILAVDISEEAIKKANKKMEVTKNKIEFRVENCENLNLDSNSFDVIYGSGILHHLDLEKSLSELKRILKKDGTILFVEPLGTNPIINFYRKLTPKSRSDDEHPFNFRDIKLIKKIFGDVEVDYYGFLTLVFFPFYKNPKNSKFFKFISFLDKLFLKIKFFNFLAWSILIKAKKI